MDFLCSLVSIPPVLEFFINSILDVSESSFSFTKHISLGASSSISLFFGRSEFVHNLFFNNASMYLTKGSTIYSFNAFSSAETSTYSSGVLFPYFFFHLSFLDCVHF